LSTLQEARKEFIHIYQTIASRRGLPTVFGRIMATFFLEERELSQKEISDLTGYSVGSVSKSLNHMGLLGLIRKRKDLSTNRYVYSMNVDFKDLAAGGLQAWVAGAEMSLDEIRRLRQKLGSIQVRGKKDAARLHARLKDIEDNTERLVGMIRGVIAQLKERGA